MCEGVRGTTELAAGTKSCFMLQSPSCPAGASLAGCCEPWAGPGGGSDPSGALPAAGKRLCARLPLVPGCH